MTYFARRSGEGNCGPTAMTNLAYLYQCMGYPMLLNGNIYSTYNKMVEISGYDWTGKKSFTLSQAKISFEKYTENYTNYKVDAFQFIGNFWSYYKDHINRGNPIFTRIEGIGDDGKNTGHAVIAYGYTEYSALVITGDRFLIVADGWSNSSVRVLNFDYYNGILGVRMQING